MSSSGGPRRIPPQRWIGAAPGFGCQEAIVGTNSIGAALLTRSPSLVRGFEHFADGLTPVLCASNAVTDPLTGRQVGVVNMTCVVAAYSPVMPALVGRVVHETQQRLLSDYGATATALYAAFLQARRRTTGPMAVLDGRSMFVNTAGALIIDAADRAALCDRGRRRSGPHLRVHQRALSSSPLERSFRNRLLAYRHLAHGARSPAIGPEGLGRLATRVAASSA